MSGKHHVKNYPAGGSHDDRDGERSRWFNYLLIGAFSVAAIAMVIMIAAAIIVPPIVQSTVDRYTATQPMKITHETLPAIEQDELDDRVENFADAIEHGETPEPLILTGNDLNALLQKLWEDEELPGEMALRIEDGRLLSDLSIPLKPGMSIGPFSPDVTGRYLNGTVTLRVALDGNTLTADIERFVINDKTLPGWIVDAVEREYLQTKLLENADLREFTAKLARIQVSANSVLLEAATTP